MSTFTRTITPSGTGSRIALLPLMQPGNGNSMTVTVATHDGTTETLAAAVLHYPSLTLLQEQGPTGGVNSITVNPNANDNGLYIAAYQCSSLAHTLDISVTAPNGKILGLRRVRRSGAWVLCVHRVRRSGAWTEVARQVRRSGAWVYTTF